MRQYVPLPWITTSYTLRLNLGWAPSACVGTTLYEVAWICRWLGYKAIKAKGAPTKVGITMCMWASLSRDSKLHISLQLAHITSLWSINKGCNEDVFVFFPVWVLVRRCWSTDLRRYWTLSEPSPPPPSITVCNSFPLFRPSTWTNTHEQLLSTPPPR